MNRIVLQIDLDYFYAQLEQLRRPELAGKPVAVCMFSGRTEFSGAVAAANYPARALGVRAGMPIVVARQKAPEIVLIKADRDFYESVSDRIMEIIRVHGEKFEQASIDEAYIEVSEKTKGSFTDAKKLAKELKAEILEKEGLTCSVGVGPNKLIAKMAAGVKKPDGLTVITPTQIKEFLRSQRITDLFGIGPKTEEALASEGVKTISQLAAFSQERLRELFGQNKGTALHEKALGLDDSPVEEKEQTQYSRIVTLKQDTNDWKVLIDESDKLAQDLQKKADEAKKDFANVSIILISNKLEGLTRSRTLEKPSNKSSDILKMAQVLFREFFDEKKDFVARRFGLRIAALSERKTQKSVFDY